MIFIATDTDILNFDEDRQDKSEAEINIDDSLFKEYYTRIYSIVSRILSPYNLVSEIEDCIGSIFLELCENPEKYNPNKGNIEAYICILSRSAALNYLKKYGSKKSELVGDFLLELYKLPETDNADGDLMYQELIGNIIKSLNKGERVLFTMKYIYFYTPEEISSKLRISRPAVDMRVNRLKKKIRKILNEKGDIYEQ